MPRQVFRRTAPKLLLCVLTRQKGRCKVLPNLSRERFTRSPCGRARSLPFVPLFVPRLPLHTSWESSVSPRMSRARLSLFTAGTASLALLATACGGSGAGSSSAPKDFSYLSVTENTTVKTALTTLSKGACKAENKVLPLKVETVPQASLDQKLQLLAGQDALPVQFAAGNAPALTNQLEGTGKIADL